MPPPTQANREMSVKVEGLAEDALLIRGFSYSEELGRPFTMTVVVAPTSVAVTPGQLLGHSLTVRLVCPGKPDRFFNGLVASASIPGNHDILEYRLSVIPNFAVASYRTNCDWNQGKTALEVIKETVQFHHAELENKCDEVYEPLEFCVQYRESDLAFVTRLMEQFGVYYYSKHLEGSNTLVLCDGPLSHTQGQGDAEVPFYAPGSSHEEAAFSTWGLEARMCKGLYDTKDYNFKTPKNGLSSSGVVVSPFGFDHSVPSWTDFYEYPGEFLGAAGGEKVVSLRAEALAAGGQTFTGSGDVRGVYVGCVFKLMDPNADLSEGLAQKYLVTGLQISGQADNYDRGSGGGTRVSCSVTAVKETQVFRLWPSTPKPVIAGAQTAVVVGPEDQEIHTDEFGRVRVCFKWDRFHGSDESDTSCWVRVAQLWAGKQWGAMFLPRVGHEVVVQYLDGDPDRPLVTGAVYNADNMPPYAMPDNKNISGIKSNSTTGGSGFNEIKFDDTKGKELLFIHAEKSHHVKVKGSQAVGVSGSAGLGVGGDLNESVGKDHNVSVTGNSVQKVKGDAHITVVGDSVGQISGAQSLKVTGSASLVYSADYSQGVQGDYFVKAANICIEASTNVTIKVGGTSIAIESGGVTIETTGTIELKANGGVKVESGGGKVEITGSAGVKMSSSATVELSAPTIKNNA